MLSIQDSSDPSCSSKASDLAAGHEAPKFSIRDYVFKSRSKDVGINWPFPGQLLQLCLDNGIRDLLPPFESLSLVRAHCFSKEVESEQLLNGSENKPISKNGKPEEDVKLVSSDQSQHSLPEGKRELKVHQEDSPDINASSVTSHDLIEGVSEKRLGKKCRLAVKPCNQSETSRPEELVCSLTVVAEPMASKICPVCKSFTSSSNTTLNAHIDQCLSSEQSNASVGVTGYPKSKVKPRKKRLMVDIYTTAPHCTLEELDKRNGTNWATDLSLVAPVNNANLETKRMKFSVSDTVDRGNVGDIYVDSNGMKLLILSKFDDSHPSLSRKNLKLKKIGKGFKASRTSLITKKKSLKFMKDNPQNKKLRGVKGFKDKFEPTSEDDNIAEAHQEKEESLSQLLSAQEKPKNSISTTLGHWVCSKRSDLARKLDGKVISKGSEHMPVTTRKLSVRLSHLDSGNSSTERSALNVARSSRSMASPKTRRVNILSNTEKAMYSEKKSSPPSSNLNSKLLPSDDSFTSGCVANISSPNESQRPSLKARKCLTSKQSTFSRRTSVSLDASKVDESEKLIAPRKFQHRSISGCSKWLGGEKYSDVSRGFQSSAEDIGLISRASKADNNHQSNFSKNQQNRSSGVKDPMRSTVNVTLASDKNVDPGPEKREESFSRNESQIESASQRSVHNEEVQDCGETISTEIICQELQLAEPDPPEHNGDFQTDSASIQQPHPCFSNHEETGLENNQKKSSTTSSRVECNQYCSMIIDVESSSSPVSTTSIISSPSHEEDKHKDSYADQLAKLAPVQDKLHSMTVRKDNNVKLSLPAREPSCSCSQSLSRESQLTDHTRKKMASNLFIKPSTLSFQPGPSLESPTESVITMASSESAVKISNPCSHARIQASSNPILRLMGKDLVVNTKDPVQLPEFLPCDSHYPSSAKFVSFGLPNLGGFSYSSCYHYLSKSTANHHIPLQPFLLQRTSDKFNPPSQYSIDNQNQLKPSADSPYIAREVIAIDNDPHGLVAEPRRKFTSLPQHILSSNLMVSQKPFTCFPSQNPYASGAVNFH